MGMSKNLSGWEGALSSCFASVKHQMCVKLVLHGDSPSPEPKEYSVALCFFNTKTYYTLPWKSSYGFRMFWKNSNTDLGRLHNSAHLHWPFSCLILFLNLQEFLHINSIPLPDHSHFPFIIIVRVEVGGVRKNSVACAKDRPDLYRRCLVQWKHTRGFSIPFRLLDFLQATRGFSRQFPLIRVLFQFFRSVSHIKTALNSSK